MTAWLGLKLEIFYDKYEGRLKYDKKIENIISFLISFDAKPGYIWGDFTTVHPVADQVGCLDVGLFEIKLSIGGRLD